MLSWNVVRVWTIDWYDDRQRVVTRLLARLEEVKSEESPLTSHLSPLTLINQPFDPSTEDEISPRGQRERVYEEAYLGKMRKMPPFDETNGTVSKAVRADIDKIIHTEQPVVAAWIYRRIAGHLGYPNGQRLQNFIDWQLEPYYRDPRSTDDAPIYWLDRESAEDYRTFRPGAARKIEEMPLPEVANAMRHVSEEQGSMSTDDLKRAAMRALGFTRRAPKVDAVMDAAYALLANEAS